MIRTLSSAVATAALAFSLTAAAAEPASGPAPAGREALARDALGLMVDNAGPGQAEALLGVLYLRGGRIEIDPVAAAAWLQRAAAAGHPAGLYAAARMYAEGLGVPQDRDRARALLGDRDPASFGPMAQPVRALRAELGLPESAVTEAVEAPAEAAAGPDMTPAPPAPVPVPEPVPDASPDAMAAAEPVPDPPPPTAAAAPSSETAADPAAPTAPVTDTGVMADTAPPDEPPGTAPVEASAPAEEPAEEPEETAAAAPPPTAPPAAPSGPAYAQLATLFSEQTTHAELERLRTLIPQSVLNGRTLTIRPSRLGDGRSAWRIVVPGFADVEDARAFCATVATGGLGCLPRG